MLNNPESENLRHLLSIYHVLSTLKNTFESEKRSDKRGWRSRRSDASDGKWANGLIKVVVLGPIDMT